MRGVSLDSFREGTSYCLGELFTIKNLGRMRHRKFAINLASLLLYVIVKLRVQVNGLVLESYLNPSVYLHIPQGGNKVASPKIHLFTVDSGRVIT